MKNKTINTIHIDITYACNYRCEYCYQTEDERKMHLSETVYENFFKFLKSRKETFNVHLIGGEPFLYPKFYEMCERIIFMGHKVSLTTNFSLPKEKLQKFIDITKGKISFFEISIHPTQIKDLDEFFEKLRWFKSESGLDFDDFQLNCVLSEDNFSQTKNLKQRVESEGFKLNVQRMFEGDNYYTYNDEIEEYLRSEKCVDIPLSLIRECKEDKGICGTACRCGNKFFKVLIDGKIKRCFTFQGYGFDNLGHLAETAEVKVLKDYTPCFSLNNKCKCYYGFNKLGQIDAKKNVKLFFWYHRHMKPLLKNIFSDSISYDLKFLLWLKGYIGHKKAMQNSVAEFLKIEENHTEEHHKKFANEKRESYDFDPEITSLLAYQSLNKIKEIELKRKVEKGKKVKVLFYVECLSKFSGLNIYKEMEKNPLFEPYIYLVSTDHGKLNVKGTMEDYFKEFESLKGRGYRVVSGYDENLRLIPFEQFKPDIVFTTDPCIDYRDIPLTNVYLNVNYLVCYIFYGMATVNNYGYVWNNRRINTAWKNFCLTYYDYYQHLEGSTHFGLNAVLLGSPKLDNYAKPVEECKIPEKIDNGKKIVIYAPHFSTYKQCWTPSFTGTFHIYHNYFLNLVKTYPNINFVFKPHPHLQFFLEKEGIMSRENYCKYVEKWCSYPNGILVDSDEYIELFKRSSCLITDCISFIGEYLPSEHPCIYLYNPSRERKTYLEGFTDFGKKILKEYYLSFSEKEIQKNFEKVVLQGIDPTKEARLNIINKEYYNIGHASKNIVEYIEKALKD